MTTQDRAQITLITPPQVALETFPATLARVMDASPVACLRLSLASRDEDHIARVADALRELAHARDVPIVIDRHVLMAERLGLDGVHLPDGARGVRKLRTDLGSDAIIGAFCGQTRHEGMNAGEAGADYVAFGPIGSSALGDGAVAALELFQWWSEIVEVPVIAEGGLTADLVAAFAPFTDFFAVGDEIWAADDPAAALAVLTRALR
ncbi:MAG: thiamine phosphate synthase [Pseudomonadota bacterium]